MASKATNLDVMYVASKATDAANKGLNLFDAISALLEFSDQRGIVWAYKEGTTTPVVEITNPGAFEDVDVIDEDGNVTTLRYVKTDASPSSAQRSAVDISNAIWTVSEIAKLLDANEGAHRSNLVKLATQRF